MKRREKRDHEDCSGVRREKEFRIDDWTPKTETGRKVKAGEINSLATIIDRGEKIIEPEIVDALLKSLEHDLLMIGQSKGKFGGGKRTIWRQTQKKTMEGNKPSFATMAVVGNKDGFIGIGMGKAKETMPAREKAVRAAKLSIIKIKRGCGSWECYCGEPHSIPFAVEGKSGSSRVKLMPAPKGTGLVVAKECQKILALAGIKDLYSKTAGQTVTRVNLLYACLDALKKLTSMKTKPDQQKVFGILEGQHE